jgi:hypothetical protein
MTTVMITTGFSLAATAQIIELPDDIISPESYVFRSPEIEDSQYPAFAAFNYNAVENTIYYELFATVPDGCSYIDADDLKIRVKTRRGVFRNMSLTYRVRTNTNPELACTQATENIFIVDSINLDDYNLAPVDIAFLEEFFNNEDNFSLRNRDARIKTNLPGFGEKDKIKIVYNPYTNKLIARGKITTQDCIQFTGSSFREIEENLFQINFAFFDPNSGPMFPGEEDPTIECVESETTRFKHVLKNVELTDEQLESLEDLIVVSAVL